MTRSAVSPPTIAGRNGRCAARCAAGLALVAASVLGGGTLEALAASEPAAVEPARFLIEELRIEGTQRGSRAVVISESRLTVGTAYTEDELRDAVVRIHRLPFVLTTEFSLAKGSRRGAYVLVIRVFETHRLFYNLDRRYTRVDEPVILDGVFADEDSRSLRAAAGYRLRLGAYGEGVVAADTEQGLQAGYTHYNLFGRGGAVSVAVGKDYDDSTVVLPLGLDPRFSGWRFDRGELFTGRLALPLTGNHGLLVHAEWLHGDAGSEREVLGGSALADRVNHRNGIDLVETAAAWIWDDSDDPLTPRSGRTFEIGIEHLRLDAEGDIGSLVSGEVVDPDLGTLDSELTRVTGRAAVHLPLGTATSVSWNGRAAVGRARLSGLPLGGFSNGGIDGGGLDSVRYDVVEASAGAVVRRALWQPAERFVTLWLEGIADVSYQAVDLDHPLLDDAVTEGRFGLRLTLRDSWGVLHAGLYYVAVDGSGP